MNEWETWCITNWLPFIVEQICRGDWNPWGASEDQESPLWNDLARIYSHLQAVVRDLQHPGCLLPQEGGYQQCAWPTQEIRGALRKQWAWSSHDLQQYGLLLSSYRKDAYSPKLLTKSPNDWVTSATTRNLGRYSFEHLRCALTVKQARVSPKPRHERSHSPSRNDAG